MSGGCSLANQISLVRSQFHLRRFDESTIGLVESILVSKDVKSLIQIRNALKKLLRSESKRFLQEIADASVDQKLLLLQFFIRAFALVGDVESCLALRYEALLLRERNSVNDNWLQVSYQEWFNFAKDSFHNGFYSIAIKGCEKALSFNDNAYSNSSIYTATTTTTTNNRVVEALEEIKKLKSAAVILNASHSVQAQATEHLKSKKVHRENIENDSHLADARCSASSMFRNGIKKRNLQKFRELQSLHHTKNEV